MTCAILGCDRKVDPKWCLCAEHWRVVPEDLRTPLTRAYSPTSERQGLGFYAALSRVQSWISKTFGAQDNRDRRSWDQLVAWVRSRDAARGQSTPAASSTEDSEPGSEPAPAAQMRLL